jgi:hypothetical protein
MKLNKRGSMKTILSIPLITSLLIVSVSAKDLVLEKTIGVAMANRGGACDIVESILMKNEML